MKFTDIFLSSTGEGLAQRWESFFSGIIPVILIVSNLFGWNIAEIDLNSLNGQIVTIIASTVAIWKALKFIEGWARARFNKANGLGKFAR